MTTTAKNYECSTTTTTSNQLCVISGPKEIKFTKLDKIGGSENHVYNAVLDKSHPCGEIRVAAKYIHKDRISEAERQIQILSLYGHENIVKLIDHVETEDGTIIIFMEFCETTCFQYTERNEDNLLTLTKQLLEVKKYLQEIGIDDCKMFSHNVLVKESNGQHRIKLVDFTNCTIRDEEDDSNDDYNWDHSFGEKCSNFKEIGCLILECIFSKLDFKGCPSHQYPKEKYLSLLREFGMVPHQAAMLSTLVYSLLHSALDTYDHKAEGFLQHVCFYTDKMLKDFIVDVANFIHGPIKSRERIIRSPSLDNDISIDSMLITKLESHSSDILDTLKGAMLNTCCNELRDILEADERFIGNMMKIYSSAKYPGYFKLSDIILLLRNTTQHFDEILEVCDESEKCKLFDPQTAPGEFLMPYNRCYPLFFVWMWYCMWPISETSDTYKKFHIDFPVPHFMSEDMFADVEKILFAQEQIS